MAGNDAAKLVVAMEARLNQFQKQMERAGVIGDQAARKIEDRFKRLNPQVNTSLFDTFAKGGNALLPILSRVAAGFAGIASAQKALEALDSYTKIQNQLKVTGLQGDQLKAVFDNLYASAQAQGAPLEANVTLYSRLSQAQKDLNATTPELLKFTDGVAQALKVQGTSATEASGALLQLSQALSNGKVQSEEFNSLLDGGQVILKTVAAGMVEAGGSVSKLTALVKDGQISSEAFFRAFLAGMPRLEQQSKQASLTIGQASEKISNAFISMVGAFDTATNSSGLLASGLDLVAKKLERIAAIIPTIHIDTKLVETTGRLAAIQRQQAANIAAAEGLLSPDKLKKENFFYDPARPARPVTPTPGTAYVSPIKASDYAVPDDAKAPKGRKMRTPAERHDFDEEIRQVREHTLRLQEEAKAVGQDDAAMAKAKVTADLINAAKRQGIAITDEVRAKIEQEAEAYAQASRQVDKAREHIQEINEFSSQFGQALNNAFTDAIVNGEKLNVVLQNLLKSLAQMAINSAFQSIFDAPKGGGLSLFGQLIKGFGGGGGENLGAYLYHSGGTVGSSGHGRTVSASVFASAPRFHSGLMPDEQAAILQKGELVIPRDAVKRGVSASSSGGGVSVTLHNSFQSGVTATDVARMLPELKRQTIAGVQEAIQRRKLKVT